MNNEEIRNLSDQDLQAKLAEVKSELADMRRVNRISPLENPMRISAIRKDVARMATEISTRKA
ncbi:MAG: 50S ribosomal protein L29 [Schleiferiaceae bacterium]|jgi:large subunit ribosomal protein L29|nr:50S ribosomal protein L29 [Flavobacteriales bacterium]MDA9256004.1 50S ribosomal protein L29 [Schleiferiaceae bacterium]NCF57188.1 50S ribosomal protein L29 [Bacteroidota bacterium]NCG44162.1 50S ribosomal protein L29 [Pseudomonadota bacterium]MBT3571917.1 50S ribosomal protein L29 [Flavobacteriales bacterium]